MYLELFLIGFATSFGPCFAFCGPVILPYIASTKKTWKEGLYTFFLFSLTRTFLYTLLGGVVSLGGIFVLSVFHRHAKFLFISGGIFISLLGLLIIFGKNPNYYLCKIVSKKHLQNNYLDALLLGFIMGIFPCLPVLAVFSYIALESKNIFQGIACGFSFGVGKLISPLVLTGALVGTISEKISSLQKRYTLFKMLCGVFLVSIGIQIIIKGTY